MLYTRKGDKGTTTTFGCDQSISKSSAITEALGALDEVNSFLGVVKTGSTAGDSSLGQTSFADITHQVQEDLFIVQAEIAGADKVIGQSQVERVESAIAMIEKSLPQIKTFFVSGGTELAAKLDFARTLARRAERRVVAVSEEGKVKISPATLVYLNRLSSLLYALARLSNHIYGKNEESPKY